MSAERKDLLEQAEELGIKVDGRWSDEKVQAEIDKALGGSEKKKGSKSYSYTGKGRFEVLGVHIHDEFQPSDALVKNDKFMAKLKYAVKCGVVKEL